MFTDLSKLTKSQLYGWAYSLSEVFPDVFDTKDIGDAILDHEDTGTYNHLKLRQALLNRLKLKTDSCEKCELKCNRLGTSVPGDGSVLDEPSFMIIGEGPGQYEARSGVPFIGWHSLMGSRCAKHCTNFNACYPEGSQRPQAECTPDLIQLDEEDIAARASLKPWKLHTAGQILELALASYKKDFWRQSWNNYGVFADKPVKKSDIYITNMIKCRSVDGAGKDAKPPKESVEACLNYLLVQICIVQPKVLILLGATAAEPLTGIKGFKMGENRGKVFEGPGKVPMVVDYHPSYILRQDEVARKPLIDGLHSTFDMARKLAYDIELQTFESPIIKGLDTKVIPTFPETLKHLHSLVPTFKLTSTKSNTKKQTEDTENIKDEDVTEPVGSI